MEQRRGYTGREKRRRMLYRLVLLCWVVLVTAVLCMVVRAW